MNEQVARTIALIRAIETADSERAIFSSEDRSHASRAAGEMARWRASEGRQPVTPELFIGERAKLLSASLEQRAPALARAARAVDWYPWIDVVLPAAALTLGVLTEHMADRQHVNVLAFPLLAIVVWNAAVYLWLLLRPFLPALRAAGVTHVRGPRLWLTRIAQRTGSRRGRDELIGRFVQEWAPQVAPLMAARAARVLHLSAALFAVGAIAGLYVRGLVFEYRAGWESTFLDAPAVHAVLSFFLAPAAQWLGVAFPSVDDIAAMRFTAGLQPANAALWIHLYAVTVGAAVIVPRLVLALVAAWQQQRRSRFELDLTQPYFRRLAGSLAGSATRLQVVPYSYHVDPAQADGLRAIARQLLGDDAQMMLQQPVAYGSEIAGAEATAQVAPRGVTVALTLGLFNLAATPENENHGVFLKALRGEPTAMPVRLAALIDESGYRRRLGSQAGAKRRLDERRDAWRYFCRAIGVDAVSVDLTAPDLAAIERELEPVLAGYRPPVQA